MDLEALRVFQNFQRLYSAFGPLLKLQRTYHLLFGHQSRVVDPYTVPAVWSVESDPLIPRRFKEIYRGLLSTNTKDFNFKRCGAHEYIILAKAHSRDRTPVTKGEWWKRVCARYSEGFGSNFKPSVRTRSRLLHELGLESLPENPAGRPSKRS
jgi:hypothetical protein